MNQMKADERRRACQAAAPHKQNQTAITEAGEDVLVDKAEEVEADETDDVEAVEDLQAKPAASVLMRTAGQ